MALFEGAGKQAGEGAVEKAGPILRDAEIRLGAILHSLLDRINIKCDFHLSVDPPKARYANPPPEEDKTY